MTQAATGEISRTNAEITADLINRIADVEMVSALALFLSSGRSFVYIEGFNVPRPPQSVLPIETDLSDWLLANATVGLPDARAISMPLHTMHRIEGWMCLLAKGAEHEAFLSRQEFLDICSIQARLLASYRRRNQQRNSNRLYRQMVNVLEEQVEEAVAWISRTSGLIEDVNEAFERLADASCEELTDKSLLEIENIGNSDEVHAAVVRSLEERRSVPLRLQRQMRKIPVSITARVAGKRVCVTFTDHSATIARRRRLLLAERRGTVYHIIGKLLHDVNNPLTAVFGFAQIISAREQLPQQVREDISRIVSESKRSREIISKLSGFLSTELREREQVDLNATIAESAELQTLEGQMRNVQLRIDLEPHLPMVYADPFELQCLVDELIDNAFQVYSERHIEGTMVVRSRKRDKCIVVEFEDDAGGAKHPEKVFEPFFADRSQPGHLGLGLAFAKAIVENTNGSISFTNTDSGAKVTCSLPVEPYGG